MAETLIQDAVNGNGDGGEPEQAPVGPEPARAGLAAHRRGAAAGGAAAAGVIVGAFLVAAAAAGGRGRVELQAGESVALRVRPRRAFWRYVATLGLWELDRRATRFTVTDRRLLVEDGVLHHVVSAVPLDAVDRVSLRTGPWQGYVQVVGSTRHGSVQSDIGPLRTPVARRFAAALARRSGAELAGA
jgi:membrane protein YdbS with pleckstrin-like domain